LDFWLDNTKAILPFLYRYQEY